MRHALWFSLLLIGCFKPRDTGPTSMVGRVLDHEGQPLSGLRVTTLESRSTTDADGHFAVSYKAPSQFITFDLDGIQYRRAWQPETDTGRIDIQLPEAPLTTWRCDVPTPCTATAEWSSVDGLTATRTLRCGDRDTSKTRIPAGMNAGEATCRVSATALPIPLVVRQDAEALTLATRDR